ncbi:FlgO family outer membrane protein [Poseidonibacter antarcticus]|uniref:FlgO family outer membrane protein n=1 Tax=Poseidonibacter antarcticus TaxID=2478538 RepID=UPI000EF4F65D|nr:FlgO family outer membrane protein [Poseidonibacter antarcticus]
MSSSFYKVIKLVILSSFVTLFLSSCSHKNLINGTNDFHSLVSDLVDDAAKKIKSNTMIDDIVLVSDFVNLDRLKNRSELGFLLSDILKDRLVSLNILVREIEFGKEFELGESGFNLLTRDHNKIISKKVEKERFAVVGTYSITSRSLNLFIKLIDIRTGYILASSYERTDIDEEILQLEGSADSSSISRPHIVL